MNGPPGRTAAAPGPMQERPLRRAGKGCALAPFFPPSSDTPTCISLGSGLGPVAFGAAACGKPGMGQGVQIPAQDTHVGLALVTLCALCALLGGLGVAGYGAEAGVKAQQGPCPWELSLGQHSSHLHHLPQPRS